MKKILLSLSLVFCLLVNAQQTAQDWTNTDCISGNTYNLFNLLDSNKVVVMEFEMGCYSCAAASVILEERKQAYDTAHPGKVEFFVMDYWPGNTCTTVSKFINDSSFTMPGFANCGPDKDYYTLSMPMPMVVIAAGSNHSVYYKKLYFDSTDTQDLTNAIDLALSDIASGINNPNAEGFSVSVAAGPAMAGVYLNVSLSGGDQSMLDLEVYDMLGNKVGEQKTELTGTDFAQIKLDLPEVMTGIYFVRYNCGAYSGTLRFITGR